MRVPWPVKQSARAMERIIKLLVAAHCRITMLIDAIPLILGTSS